MKRKIGQTRQSSAKIACLESKGYMPLCYASAGDFCQRTGFPRAMVKYAQENGAQCRDAANRIHLQPFLDFYSPILAKLFSDGGRRLAGVDKVDVVDLGEQRARLAAAQAVEQETKNAVEAEALVTREGVKRELWEGGLKEVADAWKNYERATGARLAKAAHAAGVPATVVEQLVAIAVAGVVDPVRKLREVLEQTKG